MKDENFNEEERFKKMIENFLKNMLPNNNINEKRKSFFDEIFNEGNITTKTSTFITEDGTKIIVSSGFNEFNPDYQKKSKNNKEKISILKKHLQDYVSREEFEKAAETRDLIISLEKEMPNVENDDTSVSSKDEENDIWDL